MLRAFNKNQILIIFKLKGNPNKTVTSFLRELSKSEKIPLSTLKLNTKILKDLKIIRFEFNCPIKLTGFGKLIAETLDYLKHFTLSLILNLIFVFFLYETILSNDSYAII